MQFKILIFTVIAILVLIAVIFLVPETKKISEELKPVLNEIPEDISELTEEKIILILKTNNQALRFLERNQNFIFLEKIVLTEELIIERKEGPEFTEMYEGLELEENRYLMVKLINSNESKGLLAVLDLKDQIIAKVAILLLAKTDVGVN